MWDERYSEPGYAYGTEPNDFLVSVADRIPDGPVLSLAEGEGRNAVFLAGLGHEVTAVDASSVGLAKADRLAAERGVSITTVHADLADFEIKPGQWQAIVSIYCHIAPELRSDLHRRCVSGLASGGVFILEAFTPRQLAHGTGGPKDVDLLMEPDDLRRELEGLDVETFQEIERTVSAGKYHGGTAVVLQILAAKP